MTTSWPTRLVAIAGSLRERSYNRGLVRAAVANAPPDTDFVVLDLEDIPLFSEDVEAAGIPLSVKSLVDEVSSADGILIATPEYNGAIPGVLKNALDWLSRFDGAATGKPFALMGATPGRGGTVRAQVALQDLLIGLGGRVLPLEVFVSAAARKFSEEGHLQDPTTQVAVAGQVRSLVNRALRERWAGHQSEAA